MDVRRIILACFVWWFVWCGAIWYWTSRVQRADADADTASAHGAFPVPPARLQFVSVVPEAAAATLDMRDVNTTCDRIRRAFAGAAAHTIECRVLPIALPPALTSRNADEIDDTLRRLPAAAAADLTFFVLLPNPSAPANNRWTIGKYRHAWIAAPFAALSDAAISNWRDLARSVAPSGAAATDVPHPARVSAVRDHYRVSLSLLNGDPAVSDVRFEWEAARAVRDHLGEFISRLSPLFDISIDSQVLHHTSIVPDATASAGSDAPPISGIEYDAGSKSYFVRADTLQHFAGVNGRWNVISPLVDSSIELMLYIPSAAHCPLFIRSATETSGPTAADAASRDLPSFIVPGGWGAVAIWNAPVRAYQSQAGANAAPAAAAASGGVPVFVLSSDELQAAMHTFRRHLRILFGIDDVTDDTSNFDRVPPPSGVAEWEVSRLRRARIASHWAHAEHTLRSFYELVDSAPHMPIADEPARLVSTARQQLRVAADALRNASLAASSEDIAMRALRVASASAHRAFYDPAMVGLLYFPDEHLYAVYTPFFIPVLIPILTALIAIVRKRIKRKRRRAAAAAAAAAAPAPAPAPVAPAA